MKTGIFRYLGSDDVTPREYKYSYSDEWLKCPSDNTPYEMLQFSLCLAMSASLKGDITKFYNQVGYEYTDSIDYEGKGLNVLAGDKVIDSIYYPAPEVNGKYYVNSVGYAIGYKKIDDLNVILVSIRGGNYGSEWGGNFNIGLGEDAAGFEIGAQQVLDGIKNEIDRRNLKENIKVWVVGYSRAAAIANLTGAKLNQGVIEGVTKENVYSFSFECPRGTKDPEAFSEKYNNLISVANPNDIVPKLAESVFGFRRYGKTFYIPAPENDITFQEKLERMEEFESHIIPFKFNPSLNASYTENVFINDLAFSFGSLKKYVNEFQVPLMQAVAVFLGGAKEKVSRDTMIALGEMEETLLRTNPINTSRIARLFGAKPHQVFRISFEAPLLQNHAMELTLSWIASLKGYEDFGKQKYRLVFISNSSEIAVFDSENKLKANIRKDVIQEIEDGIWCEIDNNNQAVILLPIDDSYKIDVYSKKTVDPFISVADFDMSLNLKDRIYNYETIEDTRGFMVIIKVPKDLEDVTIINRERKIEPKEILNQDEIVYYQIRSNSEGNGKATGGGYFTKGEMAQVIAFPKEGYKFLGWYLDEQKVSDHIVYRFPVNNDVSLIAKFE